MNSRSKKRLYVVVILLILITMLWNALSQPGVSDFKSAFEEVDLYRNENNTGPIERVYIVATNDTLWNEMEQYGQLMPYSKLGTTKVYFFHQDSPYPIKALSGRTNFDPAFERYCLARYVKNSNGLVQFTVFPFKP